MEMFRPVYQQDESYIVRFRVLKFLLVVHVFQNEFNILYAIVRNKRVLDGGEEVELEKMKSMVIKEGVTQSNKQETDGFVSD